MRLHIYMNHTRNPEGCTTVNIVADITGSEKPEEASYYVKLSDDTLFARFCA